MKQTIEIDVLEGYKIGEIQKLANPGVIIYFEKKEPEFIEVREFLFRSRQGSCVMVGVAQKGFESIEDREADKSFIKWIDQDWRKVEI